MKLLTAVFVASSALFLIGTKAQSDDMGDGEPVYYASLTPPFTHSEFDNEWWDFGGDALIKVYNYVRLTSQQKSQKGYIWTKTPLSSKAWSIVFDFKIHGSSPSLYGDGLAFWFVDGPYVAGNVFGYKDQFNGLGVFFDTFPNGQHDHSFPYISAMLGDGKKTYDHANDNKGSLAGHGCEANIRGSQEPLRARVTYFKNQVLQLEFTDNGGKGWQSCFVLSNVTLPDKGYIGFSSMTGDLYDNHDVYRVLTYNHIENDIYKGADATESSKHDDISTGHGRRSWSAWFGTWLLRLGGLGVVAAVGFYIYRAMQTKSTKRF